MNQCTHRRAFDDQLILWLACCVLKPDFKCSKLLGKERGIDFIAIKWLWR